ncbi:hypothetical protein TcCL_NonESM07664 [Trypanosoma cruzi]|nr:hypothetical protein TcCL_NonESM07664 [Trypanosoma cruzi]
MRGADVVRGDPHFTANAPRFLGDGIPRQRNSRSCLPMHRRRRGTVCISVWLKNFCFILMAIVRRARLGAQDASQVCSIVWNNRWVSVPVKASSTTPDDRRSTASLFVRAFGFILLQLFWEKVGG